MFVREDFDTQFPQTKIKKPIPRKGYGLCLKYCFRGLCLRYWFNRNKGFVGLALSENDHPIGKGK